MKNFKFLLGIALVATSIYALNVYFEKPKIIDAEPIALLRHRDTIYHCSEVNKSICGTNALCGRYSLYCLKNDFEVQYLD